MLDVSGSLLSAIGSEEPAWAARTPSASGVDDYFLTVSEPIDVFYHDVPQERAAAMADKLTTTSPRTWQGRVSWAAWRWVPSTYVVCEHDRAIPLQAQEAIVERSGVAVVRLSSGHSPFLSCPSKVAELLDACWRPDKVR